MVETIRKKIKGVNNTAFIRYFVRFWFSSKGFADDLSHGLRHIDNVGKEVQILIKLCNLDHETARLLEVAIDVHDLGRTEIGNHAEISADIFSQMPLKDLTVYEKECIEFAVRNHSHGLPGIGISKAITLKEILLGLLCLCDHSDCASPEGYARSIIWWRTSKKSLPPVLSPSFSKKYLREVMENKHPGIEAKNFKDESVVAHLVYQYFATTEIIDGVRHLLNDEYLKYASKRQTMFKEIIELLLELQPN